MRPVITSLIMLLSVWLFSCFTHATGIYKWVDARGNVHYGDKPTVETVEKVNIKAQASGASPQNEAERRARQRRLLDVFQEEREAARALAQKEKQRKARVQRNCNLARDRLRNLRHAAYLYDLDKQGNRVILSDQKREEAISDTQAALIRWCK
jgi:hypothetical protein